MFNKIIISVGLLISCCSIVGAQNKVDRFSIHLSEDGKRYIKFGINAQLWARYTELNPGSKVGSNVTNDTYDIVIRRLRMQMMGMLTEKVYFHFQLGQNNINFTNNTGPYNAPFSLFDILGEYHFNTAFKIGGGLCAYGAGTTRYSAQGSTTQLSLDAPIYQQNNISSTYGNRNLSIYAKGEIHKFNYRAVVTNPYKSSTDDLSMVSSVSTLTPNPQVLGMLTYQFFEKESIEQPYNKGTYLGAKKVFNIGVGYMFQKDAMWRFSEISISDTIKEDMSVLGVDVFYDTPIGEKGGGLTVYAAFNHCDYGKDYIRMVAVPNPATSGSGSGFFGIGTGDIYYAQVGYVFNKRVDQEGKDKARAQLYVASEVAALDALKSPMTMYEVGINYYLTGSFGPKISFGYQNRGIFEMKTGETTYTASDRKGMCVLQYQISF